MWRWIRTTNIWDANRVNKIIKKTRSVIEVELDSLEKESERRMLHKLLDILDNGSHPLHSTLEEYRSDFSGRMRPTRCSTEGHRNSFLSISIRLHSIFSFPSLPNELFY